MHHSETPPERNRPSGLRRGASWEGNPHPEIASQSMATAGGVQQMDIVDASTSPKPWSTVCVLSRFERLNSDAAMRRCHIPAVIKCSVPKAFAAEVTTPSPVIRLGTSVLSIRNGVQPAAKVKPVKGASLSGAGPCDNPRLLEIHRPRTLS